MNFTPTEIFLNTYFVTEGLILDDQLAALFASSDSDTETISELVNMLREINTNVK